MKYAVTVVLLSMTLLGAGTVPPQQITWIQENTSPSKAQSLTYTLHMAEEGKAPVDIPVVNVLCGGLTVHAECSAVLPTAARPAIITGNVSRLKVSDPAFPSIMPLSDPFVGDQGCIFQSLLFRVGERGQTTSNKQNMQTLLNAFKAAKFRHISTQQVKGNQFLVTEECVGYIVP